MADFAVDFHEDAAAVLDVAGRFLRSRPVEHNLVLSLLRQRASHPEPGRYWVVDDAGEVCGVVFQSPLDFMAAVTPMPRRAAELVADVIAGQGTVLPGVSGEVGTSAGFAGQWTESTGSAATPAFGQRLYAFAGPRPRAGPAPEGRLRPGDGAERVTLAEWFEAFRAEVGPCGPRRDAGSWVDQLLAEGRLWVWGVGGRPVSFAAITPSIQDVARIGPVYTPPESRGRGYATACVAGLSAAAMARGETPILYTDLANPTSNAIYRRIGYEAVAEGMAYDFARPSRTGSEVPL